jgi:hypothetical protein
VDFGKRSSSAVIERHYAGDLPCVKQEVNGFGILNRYLRQTAAGDARARAKFHCHAAPKH